MTDADGDIAGATDADAPAPATAPEGDLADGIVVSPRRVPSPRWHPSTKIVAGVGLAIAGLGAIYLARNALTLVALSGLFAFLVAPLIRFLRRRARFPKVLALLAGYGIALVGIVLIGALIVGGTAGALGEIDPPAAAESLRDEAIDWLSGVRTIQIAGYEIDFSETVDSLTDLLTSMEGPGAAEESEDDGGDDGAGTGDDGSTIAVGSEQVERFAGSLLAGVQTIGGLLAAMLVTFLIAVYLSADTTTFRDAIRSTIPSEYDDDADRLSERLGEIWRGYLYGQLFNSLATGLLVWLALWAIGLPGSFVFGLIMALLNMIPTFGPIIAAVPGVLAAVALGSTRLDWTTMSFTLLVLALYVIVVQVQANFMAPFITGRAVQMSPATILVGLIVGFQVGGLVGSLLVVPVLATLKMLGKYVIAKLLDRDPFSGPTPAPSGRADR